MATRTWAAGGDLEFDVVDVFTPVPFAGNGLAVVYGTESLTTSQLQAIAREFNLSETAFPVLDVEDADYRLRIFTPQAELPFAGHPSIGSAWSLCRRGLLPPGRLRQDCPAGVVELEVGGVDEVVWLTGRPPRVGDEIDPAPALTAVGLTAGDQVGPRSAVAGAGLDFAYLFVRPGAVAGAVPDLQRLRRLRAGVPDLGGVAVVGWQDGTARVRVFTDDVPAAEDPATGSAALGSAPCWWTSACWPARGRRRSPSTRASSWVVPPSCTGRWGLARGPRSAAGWAAAWCRCRAASSGCRRGSERWSQRRRCRRGSERRLRCCRDGGRQGCGREDYGREGGALYGAVVRPGVRDAGRTSPAWAPVGRRGCPRCTGPAPPVEVPPPRPG